MKNHLHIYCLSAILLVTGEVTHGQITYMNDQSQAYRTAEAVFEQGPDMPEARMWHHAVALPNGNIALIGGIRTGFNSLNTVDIFFPSADSFATYQMTHTHAAPAVARLQDGRYLIAGGSANMGVPRYAETEIFDPEGLTFTKTGDMVRFRASAGAAELSDGTVMVGSAWWTHNDAHTWGELFNPETQTFSAIGPFSFSRSHSVVIPTSDGQAMLIGGVKQNGEHTNMPIEVYNPANDEISTMRNTLLADDPMWTITNPEAITSNQLMGNGHYLWLAWRTYPGVTSFQLVTVDPESKEIEKFELETDLPTSHSYYFTGQPILDNTLNRAYLLAVVMGTGSYQIAVFTVDLETGSLTKSSNYLTLSTYQLRSTPGVLLHDGRIFVAGGSVSNNFDAVKHTLFITPPEPAPPTSLPGEEIPAGVVLHQNYPNPFNPATNIRYQLPEAGHVVLEVYSITGQRLSVLIDRYQTEGDYSVRYTSLNKASGVYMYRLTFNGRVESRRMTLIR